ncbi:MAG TPA: hypothetical protein VGP94_08910, partial [Tepidisphaeraceae bacterium]|nr:hypothetical protein [Tepidisphaeraceae bacterium]
LMPIVTARIEQWNQLLGDRIDSGDVRPFIEIAPTTTERQILQYGLTIVLFGNDVIHNVLQR